MSLFSRLFSRSKEVLREEGFLSLLRWAVTLPGRVFKYHKYYIYENNLAELADASPACRVDNLTMQAIWLPITLAEYEQLGGQGFDFSVHPDARECQGPADKGTIVFWTTVNGELVNRTGMTTMRKGSAYKDIRKFYPSFVDDSRIAYAGFSETAVEYRRKGVYTWVHAEIFRYFKEKGFSRVILLEGEEQVGPRKVQDRLGSKVVREAQLLNLLPGFRPKIATPV